MRINKIELYNNKRLYNGLGTRELKLNFRDDVCLNIIEGPNGVGKSTILSELTPLPGEPSDYMNGTGKKLIEIQDGDTVYEIVYNFVKGVRSDASFMNLTTDTSMVNKFTFQAVQDAVIEVFGLDANFEALTHLSSYDSKSFALLKPVERKKFLSSIINNLDVYNNIYKTLSKRSSIFKAMVGSINTKISNLGTNPLDFKQLIMKQKAVISDLEKERDKLKLKIASTELSLSQYEVNEQRKKDLQRAMKEYEQLQKQYETFLAKNEKHENIIQIKSIELIDADIAKANREKDHRSSQIQELYTANAKHQEHISELSAKFNELLANEDYQTMLRHKSDVYQRELEECIKIRDHLQAIYGVHECLVRMAEVESFSPSTYASFLRVYNKLVKDYVDIYTKNSPNMTFIGSGWMLFPEFKKKYIIDEKFDAQKILDDKHKIYELLLADPKIKDEAYFQLDQIDKFILDYNRLNEVDEAKSRVQELKHSFNIPENWNEFFVTNGFGVEEFNQEKFNEYYDNFTKYSQAVKFIEQDELFYNSDEYKEVKDYAKELEEIENLVKSLTEELKKNRESIEGKLEIIQKFEERIKELNETKTYMYNKAQWLDRLNKLNQYIESIRAVIIPDAEKFGYYRSQFDDVTHKLKKENETLYKLKYSADLYKEYTKELESLQSNYSRIETLKKYCSPNTGIQIIFIDLYIHKILDMANKLLSYFFNGEFMIQPFVITDKEFRIPIQGNGLLIDDISSLSSSQMIAVNMCISFAIMIHSSSKFNILRLDEVDAPFDISGSNNFVGMLNNVMTELSCEQGFLITHSPLLDDDAANHIMLTRK